MEKQRNKQTKKTNLAIPKVIISGKLHNRVRTVTDGRIRQKMNHVGNNLHGLWTLPTQSEVAWCLENLLNV